MEKNDVQSGGQDLVPKQLFGSLIYSTGHLVQHLQHSYSTPKPNSQHIRGREDESLGQYDWTAA